MSKGDGAFWLARTQAAELVGLSARQFDDAIRPKLGADGTRGTAKSLRFFAPAVVSALVRYRVDQAKPPVPLSGDDALLMDGGGDSPALERLRMAKAQLAERDLAERDGDLVRRAVIVDALRPAAAGLRQAGERLAKDYGNDAAAVYNDAVDDFAAAVERLAAGGAK